MTEPAALHQDVIQIDVQHGFIDAPTMAVQEGDPLPGNDRNFSILQKTHRQVATATHDGQQRRQVAGHDALTVMVSDGDATSVPEFQGAQAVRVSVMHRDYRLGALHSPTDVQHGGGQPKAVVHGILNQMRNDFRVGFRLEPVADSLQFSPEGDVIFDDPVMSNCNLTGAIGVRMRVGLRRSAVGSPTGVAKAG